MDSTRHRICNPQKFHLHPSPIDCGCHTKGRKDLEKLGLEHWQRSLQKGIIFFFFFPSCAAPHRTSPHCIAPHHVGLASAIISILSSPQLNQLVSLRQLLLNLHYHYHYHSPYRDADNLVKASLSLSYKLKS